MPLFGWLLFIAGGSILPIILGLYILIRLPVRHKRLHSLFSLDIRDAYLITRSCQPKKEQDEPAENYEQRVKEEFERLFKEDFKDEWGGRHYFIPALMACLVTAITILFLVREAFRVPLLQNTPPPVIYALLGVIVWSVARVIRGYTLMDLTPATLYGLPLKNILAIAYGLLAQEIFTANLAKLGAFVLPTLPFSESFRFVYSRLASGVKALSTVEGVPKLNEIQGIDQSTIDTLEELGIHTTQELAFSDPLNLLFSSTFSPKVLIDWMDQSFLLNYVGDKITQLRRRGIRGAIEMADLKDANEQQLQSIANVLEISTNDVRRLIRTLYLDNQLRLIWEIWGGFEAIQEEGGGNNDI